MYHIHVQWLGKGKVLKRFLDWLWDLTILTVVTTYSKIYKLKLQSPGKHILDLYISIKAFDAKYKFFINKIGKCDFIDLNNEKYIRIKLYYYD